MPGSARAASKRKTKKLEGTKATTSERKLAVSEWDLPAGYTVDGARMATLREVVDPTTPTRALGHLSEDHRFDIAAKRIEMKPEDFQVTILGHGTIGKARAIAEVRARTKIGRHLAEIEEIGMLRGMRAAKDSR